MPDLHRPHVERHVLGKRDRVDLDLLQPRPVGAIDIGGHPALIGHRKRPVLAIIAHHLATEALGHVAVRIVGKRLGRAGGGGDGDGRVLGMARVAETGTERRAADKDKNFLNAPRKLRRLTVSEDAALSDDFRPTQFL